ncbi:MAG: hypothetical protein ACWA5R_09075 [bacterium]
MKMIRNGLIASVLGVISMTAFAVPVPSCPAPSDQQVFIGEDVNFTLSFDNTDLADTGYGPYIDLIVPVNGADGLAGVGVDGLSFASASYLGAAVTTVSQTFPVSGVLNHPFAVDNTGTPLLVNGTAGDVLVTIQLPFGSFSPDQPAAPVAVSLSMSNLADLGVAMPLTVSCGFQFGADPLDNPTAPDPSIVSGTSIGNITPKLIELSKTYVGPEDETATGINFPRQYTISVDIADGQTVTDLDVTDLLPDNMAFLSVISTSPASTTTQTPTIGAAANPPNNDLVVNFASVTGGAGSNDATVTFEYYIPRDDANANPVINASSGDDVVSPDEASALGDWTPVDPRDAGGIDNAQVDVVGPEHILNDRSIAIQKGVAVVLDTGAVGPSPGDVLEYTLQFQVSDYFAFQNLVSSDVFTDGQRFDATFTPTLSINEHNGGNTSGNFNPTNFSVTLNADNNPLTPATDGSTTVVFNISNELITRGLDGLLLGGGVAQGGTGGPLPDDTTAQANGATTGTIVFRTVIQDAYSDTYPSGDPSLDERDSLGNTVDISGDLLDVTNTGLTTGQSEADGSSAGVVIVEGNFTKTIYAINGNTAFGSTEIAAGDEVTYRLTYNLTLGDFENFVLTDYLPLPVFDVDDPENDGIGGATWPLDGSASIVPPTGQFKFGPLDTSFAATAITPLTSTNLVSNELAFSFGTFQHPANTPLTIDIIFTVTVNDQPFADRLFLTNQARQSDNNTSSEPAVVDQIVQITLTEPVLGIQKGVIATDNPAGVFNPVTTGPVAFSAPGTAGFRGAATINSNGLLATPIDSNLSAVDAGDLVSFAIVIENTGSGLRGAFDVSVADTLPPGFAIPVGGLNLNVSDGAGNPLAFTDLGGGLFGSGIQLNDNPGSPATGSLSAFNATSGANIAIISYDLVLQTAIEPGVAISNTATLTNYANSEGGVDFTTTDLTDIATVTPPLHQTAKAITATDQAFTAGNDVAIGEIVTYEVSVTIPEGTMVGATLTDTVDRGLAIVGVNSISLSPGVTTTLSSATVSNVGSGAQNEGRRLTIDFGTVTNSNTNNAVAETIIVNYDVVVTNYSSNDRGDKRNNSVTFQSSGGLSNASAPNVTIQEPLISIAKSVSPSNADAGDTLTYTLVLTASNAANRTRAFDINLNDVIPANLTYVAASLSNTGGIAPSSLAEAAGTISANWAQLDPGDTSTLSFQATVDLTAPAGTSITNNADINWTSLAGAPGARSANSSIAFERTGSSLDPGGATNDYNDTDPAVVNISPVVVSKVVVASDEPTTADPAAAIGEQVTYEITVTIPEGTVPNLVITDTLPITNGLMDYQTLQILRVGSVVNPACTIPAASKGDAELKAVTPGGGTCPTITATDTAIVDGYRDTITLSFGAVTNPADGVVTADDTIVFRVTALVVDEAVNASTDTLTNNVLVSFGAGLNASASADINLREPQLSINKVGDINTGDAGDTVVYTISIAHTGSSNQDALDVDFRDIVPANLSIVSAVSTSGIAPSTGPTIVGNNITANWPVLALGQNSEITVTATLTPAVVPGTTETNTAEIAWDSLTADDVVADRFADPHTLGDSEDRDYATSSSHPIAITVIGLNKQVTATSEASTGTGGDGQEDLTIGEEVTYQMTTTFSEGTTPGSVFTDQLPTGTSALRIVSSRIVSIGANLTLGSGHVAGDAADVLSDTNADTLDDNLVWNLGNILNTPDGVSDANDQIVFEVVARVADLPINQNGVANQVNTATLTQSGGGAPITGTAIVDLVAPVLNVNKTVITPASGLVDAGDTVTVRLTITHTAASGADAFNLDLDDTLPSPGTSWVNDATVAGTCGAGVDSSGEPVINFTVATLALGSSCTIEYDVVVDNVVNPGTTYTNSVSMAYDSISAGVVGADNRQLTDSDTASVTVIAPTLVKVVAGTNNPDTGSANYNASLDDLNVGEQVTYTLSVVFPEGVTTGAVVIDDMPTTNGVIEVLSASVTSLGGQLVTSLPGTAVLSDTNLIDGINDRVSMDFGMVTNTPDGVTDAGDTLVITVIGRVSDVPANTPSDLLQNTATFSYDTGPDLVDSADIELVEPSLNIAKTMGPVVDNVVTINLTLTNEGDGPAYDVAFEDVLDESEWDVANLTQVSISPGFSMGTASAAGFTTVTVSGASLMPGAAVAVQFTVPVLGGTNPVSNPVSNTVTNTAGDTVPGGPNPDDRDVSGGSDNAQLSFPELSSSKSGALQVDADASTDISPGDTLRYTISITNSGLAAANNVVLVDAPDANVSLVVGTVTTSQGSVTTGNTGGDTTIAVSIPSIANGSSVTVTYDVTVNNLPAGVTQLVNQGLISSDEIVDFPTDDPGPPGGDDPTVLPVNAAPDLSITKDDGGVTTTPGGVVVYTLSYANVGNQDATGVVITDTVPADSSFNAANSDPGWSCADNDPASTVCTLNVVGGLAVGASGSVAFAVNVVNPAPAGLDQIANSSSIADDGSNGPDTNPANNTDSDTTPLDATPDMTISKEDGGVTAQPGDVVVYTLTYINVGNQDATGVVITDTVPVNTTFNQASSTAGWSCADSAPASSVCTLNIGAVNSGAGGSVNFALNIDNPLPAGITDVTNTANVADDGNNGADPTPANNQDSDTTPVGAFPDLAITKDDGGISTFPGGVVAYTLSFINRGDQNATGVVVTDTVPANSTFNAANSTPGWSCADGNPAGTVCTFLIGTLDVEFTSGTIVFAVVTDTPVPAGVEMLVNQASIADDGSNGPDITPGDNSDGDTTPLIAAPDLTITKDDGGVSSVAGGVVTYTLAYENVGNQGATGVTITDVVPVNSTFDQAASTAGWSCADGAASGTSCTLLIGALAAGDSGTVNFAIQIDNPLPAGVTQVDNTASIDDDGTNGADPTPGDNSDSDSTPVAAEPDLVIIKDDGGVSTTAGGVVVYSLDYSNVGTQDATGVIVSDTVPANTVFNTSGSSAGWSCADGAIPGTVCNIAIGNLASGDNGTVSFAVMVDNPLDAGVDAVMNVASVTDDGSNGVDPTPDNNSDPDDTPIDAAPDLVIIKDDGIDVSGPGQTIIYTLSYENLGPQGATGVVIDEVVPANVTFNAAASTAGWSCADGSATGTPCQIAIGALAVGDTGQVQFAADVDDPLPAGISQIENTASITDDGSNGPDTDPGNNQDDEVTITTLNPPVGLKVAEIPDGTHVVEWTMWWFNPENTSNLPVFIVDPIPQYAHFINGTITCTATGASSCVSQSYNAVDDQVEVQAILGSDFGAAHDAQPDDLNHEIIITFRTSPPGGGTTLYNQAVSYWDENNDGDPIDDRDGGQDPVVTDDPTTVDPDDPTGIVTYVPIPVMSRTGLIIMLGLMLFMAIGQLSGRRKQRRG